jgi:hypothetical protein
MSALSDEERLRRIELACGWLLGVMPWPEGATAAHEEHGAAESSSPRKRAGAPLKAPAQSSCPSTAAAPLSSGEGRCA